MVDVVMGLAADVDVEEIFNVVNEGTAEAVDAD